MENLSNLFQTNLIVIQFSIGFIVLLFLIRFFTNSIIIFLITAIIGYNVYFFTVLNDTQRAEQKIYLKKAFDNRDEFISKDNMLKTLSTETQNLLETNKIKSKEDLEKFIKDNFKELSKDAKLNVDQKLNEIEKNIDR